MPNRVILNNVDHADLRVTPRFGAEFGDSVNQMLIFATEYEEIQREFPILFRRDDAGVYQSVALLGLDRDENLFLGAEGWQSRYVPAVQACGPFSIALQRHPDGEAEPKIHIDLDDPRVARGSGHSLFLPHGGNAPYLEQVTTVLRTIYLGLELSSPMFSAFAEAELIQPVALEIMLSENRRYDLPDFHTIDRARLAALDGAALERLNRGDYLRLAYLAAASLGNVARLIELKNRKDAAP